MRNFSVLKEFRKSDDKGLQKASTGLLWEVGLIEIKPDVHQAQPLDPPPTYEESINQGHLMISYSWANQEQVIHVKDMLEERGYRVWMDVGNMSKNKKS